MPPSADNGYFEHFQYILLFWCSILSSIWIVNNKFWRSLSIPFLYFYLFIDDALLIHDGLGGVFFMNIFLKNEIFSSELIRIKDLGEWTYWFIILCLGVLISLPGFLAISSEIREFMKKNFILFFCMSFFGLFIDLINANWRNWFFIESTNLNFLLGILMLLIEEIGEIAIISFACIWLFNINFIYKK